MKKPILLATGKGHSYFAFISKYWMAKKGVDRAFHRLCSLMRKMNAQKVVVEEIKKYSLELKKEIDALKIYYGEKITTKVYKFTFIADNVSGLASIKDLSSDKFLSSSILVNFKAPDGEWHSYLQKAIVCKPQLSDTFLLNNYIHIYRSFTCSVHLGKTGEHDFHINGTYFCQQNGKTSVCVHASLCMIINNMNIPKLDMISTEWINKTLGINHKTIKLGRDRGLTEDEILQVLKKAGLQADWHNFFDDPNSDYAEYIYRYIEGACPSLLIFSTSHSSPMHVVPVIGHTLNSDIWKAEAGLAYNQRAPLNYRPASEWVDHFIIHDDNFGMYLCLSLDSLRKITLPKHDRILRAYSAIAITPRKILTPGRESEWAGAKFVRSLIAQLKITGLKLDDWLERLDDESTPMVIRTILMNRMNYKKHLRANKDFDNQEFKSSEISLLTDDLPKHFWLSEVTLPDLYTANKSKLIDFLYICDKKAGTSEKEIAERCIQVRLPGACYFNRKSKNHISLSVKSHYPLYRHEKDFKVPEW